MNETNLELLEQCKQRMKVISMTLDSVRKNTDTNNLNSLLDAHFRNMNVAAERIIDILARRNQA